MLSVFDWYVFMTVLPVDRSTVILKHSRVYIYIYVNATKLSPTKQENLSETKSFFFLIVQQFDTEVHLIQLLYLLSSRLKKTQHYCFSVIKDFKHAFYLGTHSYSQDSRSFSFDHFLAFTFSLSLSWRRHSLQLWAFIHSTDRYNKVNSFLIIVQKWFAWSSSLVFNVNAHN